MTIEDVFSAVQARTAFRGVVPFENSSNGSVVFTLDLFADVQAKHPDIVVCGEAYVAVQHCLLGFAAGKSRSRSSKEVNVDVSVSVSQTQNQEKTAGQGEEERERERDATPNFSHIKHMYSHPQAWGQCKNFLSTHLKTAEKHDVSSTSRAAEIAAQDPSGASAALSSLMAAHLTGLDVLAKGINDKLGNTTRFLVLRNRGCGDHDSTNIATHAIGTTPTTTTVVKINESNTEPPNHNNTNNEDDDDDGNWKSLVTFTLDHANPGALAACLTAFSTHGINLTSINTRPSGEQNWHYIFFVELKGRRRRRREHRHRRGHRRGGGGGDGDGDGNEKEGDDTMEQKTNMCAVDRALSELEKVCMWYRWLGSWENRLG